MKRIATALIAGAVLAAPAGADASLSAARAEREAARAVAPLQVQSVRCFATSIDPGRRPARVLRRLCIVGVPAPAGEVCNVTVRVTAQSRPRRVSAAVIIPQRCFSIQP